MEAGKTNAFQGRLNSRSEPRTKSRDKDADLTSPRARVSLLAANEHLREKRRYLVGVQAIKWRIFFHLYTGNTYILSYPVFLYYAGSPKVPPRGPKTQRGQLWVTSRENEAREHIPVP